MPYTFRPMTEKDAQTIAAWAYPPPYDLYALSAGDVRELLDGGYYAALDAEGTLLGFFCFGAPARVPAGIPSGAYDDASLLDIGLGLSPGLCGQGLGLAFLLEGLAFALKTFAPAGFRLTVAAFNLRAAKVYERAGFHPTGSFSRDSGEGERRFTVMELSLS